MVIKKLLLISGTVWLLVVVELGGDPGVIGTGAAWLRKSKLPRKIRAKKIKNNFFIGRNCLRKETNLRHDGGTLCTPEAKIALAVLRHAEESVLIGSDHPDRNCCILISLSLQSTASWSGIDESDGES